MEPSHQFVKGVCSKVHMYYYLVVSIVIAARVWIAYFNAERVRRL